MSFDTCIYISISSLPQNSPLQGPRGTPYHLNLQELSEKRAADGDVKLEAPMFHLLVLPRERRNVESGSHYSGFMVQG